MTRFQETADANTVGAAKTFITWIKGSGMTVSRARQYRQQTNMLTCYELLIEGARFSPLIGLLQTKRFKDRGSSGTFIIMEKLIPGYRCSFFGSVKDGKFIVMFQNMQD